MSERRLGTREIVSRAWRAGLAVPAFNIPYLPMMKPVVDALADSGCFGLIAVARLEWVKFEARSLEAVRDEYERAKDERFTRLHLDHVPVIDEDGLAVDYEADIARAMELGYQSVMVDGSRLPLEGNIRATRGVVELSRASGVPVEGELGAVFGHEAGPLPPYEQLLASGKGFTDPAEARRFVGETGVDWLSVAVGNIHGAISSAARDTAKTEARLDIAHLKLIRDAARVPLVLHGGTGVRREYLRDAVRNGIAKINVATAIRQPYERAKAVSESAARRAVYDAALAVINDELAVANSASILCPEGP